MDALQEIGDPAGHSDATYWDEFFDKVTQTNAFEWYADTADFVDVLTETQTKAHPAKPLSDAYFLHGGTGNSDLIFDLFNRHAISRSVAVDISSVAISEMATKSDEFRNNSESKDTFDCKFVVGDVLLPIETPTSERFDGYIDKGLFDAMMNKYDDDCKLKSSKLFKSAEGCVTSSGGFYLMVSLAEEHIIRLLVDILDDEESAWKSVDVYELNPRVTSNKSSKLRPFCFVLRVNSSRYFRFHHFDHSEPLASSDEITFDEMNNLICSSRASYSDVSSTEEKNPAKDDSNPCMCLATLEIKPYDTEFDLHDFATSKLEKEGYLTAEDGLTSAVQFRDFEIVPVAFGICKIVIKVVTSFEDLELISELICEREEDDISSVDVVESFQMQETSTILERNIKQKA